MIRLFHCVLALRLSDGSSPLRACGNFSCAATHAERAEA